MSRSHFWIPSTLGHGETMCLYCKATNRELAVIGDLNECDAPLKLDERVCPTPGCGGTARADFVDNGVGMEQVGPFVCEACGYVEQATHIEINTTLGDPEL